MSDEKEMDRIEDLEREHEKSLIALEQEIEGWRSVHRILKARVEMAEKALERFAEKSNWHKDEYGGPVWICVNGEHPTLVAEKALKAIRES